MAKKKKAERPSPKLRNDPWISQRSGLLVMGLVSVALAVFMGWQIYPAEGLGSAILWGLGFAAAIWAVFGVSLAFNTWVRGRR